MEFEGSPVPERLPAELSCELEFVVGAIVSVPEESWLWIDRGDMELPVVEILSEEAVEAVSSGIKSGILTGRETGYSETEEGVMISVMEEDDAGEKDPSPRMSALSCSESGECFLEKKEIPTRNTIPHAKSPLTAITGRNHRGFLVFAFEGSKESKRHKASLISVFFEEGMRELFLNDKSVSRKRARVKG